MSPFEIKLLELERDKLLELKTLNHTLKTINKSIDTLNQTLFDTLGSAEMGKALENLGSSVFGITSSDFEGIEDKLNDVVGAIEEKKEEE